MKNLTNDSGSAVNELAKLKICLAHNVGVSRTAVYPLADYLMPRTLQFIHFENPAIYPNSSLVNWFMEGKKLQKTMILRAVRGPLFHQYLLGAVRFLLISLTNKPVDITIAGDEMYAFLGTLLRTIHRTRLVIFYSIDFFPRRYSNPLMNMAYEKLSVVTLRRSDSVWNISANCRDARLKQDNEPSKMLVVPHTVQNTHGPTIRKFNRFELVYVGALEKEKGVQLAIQGMPRILSRYTQARLLVVGDGPYKRELASLTIRLNVGHAVSFVGFQARDRIRGYLEKAGIGVATYVPPNPEMASYYSFPAKVIEYLAHGLPVVTTKIGIADEISKASAGEVIEYDPSEFSRAALRLMSLDDENYMKSRQEAVSVASNYRVEHILGRAMKSPLARGRWRSNFRAFGALN